MIRANRYFLAFTGIFLTLGATIFVAFQKLSPLLTHTVYYCQAFISSISLKIPHNLRLFLPIFAALIFLVFITKLTILYFSIKRLKKELVIKNKSYASYNSSPYKRFNLLVRELQLNNKAFLVTGGKPFAFCLGIMNPEIYISTALTKLVSPKELRAILLHEKSHLERKDTATMFLAKVTEFLFPFFPIISDLVESFILEREIRADKAAVDGSGSSKPLSSALKKLLLYDSPDSFSYVPSIGQSKTLETRIMTLINKSAPYRKFNSLNVVISLLSVAILSLVIFSPVNAMELHDQEQGEDVMMVCLSGGECNAWCKQNDTVVPMTKASNASYFSSP